MLDSREVRPLFLQSSDASWEIWALQAYSARTTRLSTRTACSWTVATVSGSGTSSQFLTLRNRMVLSGLACGTPGSSTVVSGCLTRGDLGLHRRCREELRAGALLWASECFNRAVTPVNDECCSPHKISNGSGPPLQSQSFFHPVY